MSRKPGDWDCRACQNLNFSRRDTCHRCGEPKVGVDYGSFGSGVRGGGADSVKPGDWYCCTCGVHNFASRSTCFKCGAFKDASAVSNGFHSTAFGFEGRPGWKSGDWVCTRLGCNEHNFASRMECFRCNAPRGYGTDSEEKS